MDKINKYILWALMAISIAITVIFFVGGTTDYDTTAGAMEAPVYTSTMINWCYVLMAIAAFATLFFAIYSFVIKAMYDIKSVIVPTVSVLGVALLLLITYTTADTTPINIVGYEGSQEPWIYKLTNMCMVTSAILASIATFVTLFGFIAKKF
jgi:hypothetical protein